MNGMDDVALYAPLRVWTVRTAWEVQSRVVCIEFLFMFDRVNCNVFVCLLGCHSKMNGTDGLALYSPLRVWTVRTAWGSAESGCV